MSRYDTAALVAALLCIAAIGLAAATVAAPVDDDEFTRDLSESVSGGSTPFDFDIDSPGGLGGGSSSGSAWTFTTACIPFLLTPLFYGIAFVGFTGIFLGVRHKLATEYGYAVVAFLVPIVVFLHATFTENCISEPTTVDFGLPEGTMINDTVSQATRTVSPETGTPILGLLVAGAFLLLVVAALVTTVRQQSSAFAAEREVSEPSPSHDLSGVARVAGEAADRIEGGESDPGNAVYQAWQDMTDHLAVPDTTTTTPAEFRAAALDAGMSPAHVATITDLFREVRYGGEEPTSDREDRAIAALRAIEDAYGGDDG